MKTATPMQRRRQVIIAARKALRQAKGHDFPVMESERLLARFMEDIHPSYMDMEEHEIRDVLDDVEENLMAWYERQVIRQDRISNHRRDFDLMDGRGRRIGAQVYICKETLREKPADANGWSERPSPELELFAVNVQTTRNGEPSGASQRNHYATTEETARTLAANKVEAMRQRYAKKCKAEEKATI